MGEVSPLFVSLCGCFSLLLLCMLFALRDDAVCWVLFSVVFGLGLLFLLLALFRCFLGCSFLQPCFSPEEVAGGRVELVVVLPAVVVVWFRMQQNMGVFSVACNTKPSYATQTSRRTERRTVVYALAPLQCALRRCSSRSSGSAYRSDGGSGLHSGARSTLLHRYRTCVVQCNRVRQCALSPRLLLLSARRTDASSPRLWTADQSAASVATHRTAVAAAHPRERNALHSRS